MFLRALAQVRLSACGYMYHIFEVNYLLELLSCFGYSD